MKSEIKIVVTYDKEDALKNTLKCLYSSIFGIRDALVTTGVVKDIEIENADEDILVFVNKIIYDEK